MSDVEVARRNYAEELRALSNLRSERLVAALAKVPREHFLGPGPWQTLIPGFSYRTTLDADPRHLYHNVLVAIDADRLLNNGEPSTVAAWLDALDLHAGEHVLHVGCGLGYYTAIMAEVVGSEGSVTAIEICPELAARARDNLSYLPHVEVLAGDGGVLNPRPTDAIFINAGATHPRPNWLDSLRLGGRLLVPLTASGSPTAIGWGAVLKVTRENEGFAASFVSRAGIFPCLGTRDPKLNEQLMTAFDDTRWQSVRSLRRDPHQPVETCWLHHQEFCLSTSPSSA